MTTLDYYNDNAANYFNDTHAVGMESIYPYFEKHLPKGAHVLDAGCGSGRDAACFLSKGYDVTAMEPCDNLALMAEQLIGHPVVRLTFQQMSWQDKFDGIWACASLLHVPDAELPDVFGRLARALKPGGVLYFSFKYGASELMRNGRHFTDMNEGRLDALLQQEGSFAILKTWCTGDVREGRGEERWLNGVVQRKSGQNLISGGTDNPFLPHLIKAINHADEIDFGVAFVKERGLALLFDALSQAMTEREARLRFLTSDYLNVTDPQALRMMMLLEDRGADVRIYECHQSSFHLKAYLFARRNGETLIHGEAFIGSSNMSQTALTHGLEWNYQLASASPSQSEEAKAFKVVHDRFENLFKHPQVKKLDYEWIEQYEKRPRPSYPIAPDSDEPELPMPEPHAVQQEALDALAKTRAEGFKRGLVVMATGLGKTYLAAFDVKQMKAKRVLFVAHREEILQQSEASFLRVMKNIRVGHYNSKRKDLKADVLFASIQTIGRDVHLDKFPADHFDYIVVDEFHHAAAATYRRLLVHFKPAFLLGLTATPDRTDQSDILGFCDGNLVYECNLFTAISQKLLCPFHYFGIVDETVEYQAIPWRSGRFDPNVLTTKLATLQRAKHVFKEWKERAKTRTLAFCVSQRHADFMATEFLKMGVKAAAVYAGSSMSRTDAIEQLRTDKLAILFSVDLFNEGVDVPEIDTVMMLRPTESKILFLQQLGRGLRRQKDKVLIVLDFIANHKSFLNRPSLLLCQNAQPRLSEVLKRVKEHNKGLVQLPDGCYVNFGLDYVDLINSLSGQDAEKDYQYLKDSFERRPTLAEQYRYGSNLTKMRQKYGSWWEMVGEQGDLSSIEQNMLSQRKDFFSHVERTSMTKSFKMVLLEALLENNGFAKPPTLDELAKWSFQIFQRRRPLIADLRKDLHDLEKVTPDQWSRYWRQNPIAAWLGENQSEAYSHFKLVGDRFVFNDSSERVDQETFVAMLQEIIEYRYATYAARPSQLDQETAEIIEFPQRIKDQSSLLFFPDIRIACGHFKAGTSDNEHYVTLPEEYGQLDPARFFIAKASGNSMNGGKNPVQDGDYLLLEVVTSQSAGSITGNTMAIERQNEAGDSEYLLRVVTKNAQGQYVLKAKNPEFKDYVADETMRTFARLKGIVPRLDVEVGNDFKREQIAELFGVEFNPGNWNTGHVVLAEQKAQVLLVTISKQGLAKEHRYLNRFVDETHFRWQTQNSTTPTNKRGQELINHEKLGLKVYLFVREHKLANGKGAPFRYYGTVKYLQHEGSAPMTIDWELND